MGLKGAVKDGSRVLVRGVEIHDPLRGDVGMEEEWEKGMIKQDGVALLVVFDQSLIRFVRFLHYRGMVTIGEECLEVGLG